MLELFRALVVKERQTEDFFDKVSKMTRSEPEQKDNGHTERRQAKASQEKESEKRKERG